jgi:hypothetical protein
LNFQVRPNVHASFHQHIHAQLTLLESVDDMPARKRKSDAKIIAAICYELQSRCLGDPDVQRQAAAEFHAYLEVCCHAAKALYMPLHSSMCLSSRHAITIPIIVVINALQGRFSSEL